jgi:DNA-binding YbaB/EbfC family protein
MDMFKMMKEAASMKKQMKKMQKELEKKTVEASSGDVTVVATGDMSISKVTIDASLIAAGNGEVIEKQVAAASNKALDAAKKMAADEMGKMTGGLGGLADMLG